MPFHALPTVRKYMDSNTHALSAEDDIRVALRRLIDEGVTGAPVLNAEGRVIGKLSEFECLKLLAAGRGGERPRGCVRDFMSTKFTSVPPDMDVYFVAGMFLNDPAHRRFLVLEGDRLVGVITRKDVLRAVLDGLEGNPLPA